jgi:hypothetical protein
MMMFGGAPTGVRREKGEGRREKGERRRKGWVERRGIGIQSQVDGGRREEGEGRVRMVEVEGTSPMIVEAPPMLAKITSASNKNFGGRSKT